MQLIFCSIPQNSSQDVLEADRYKRGDIDWYSFDLNPDVNSRLEDTGTPVNNAQAVLPPRTVSYIPSNIEFKGMPSGRWWEFEDRNTDLSKMLTQKSDISRLDILT